QTAVTAVGRADADDRGVRIKDRSAAIQCGAESSGFCGFGDQFFEAGFDDGGLARRKTLDLSGDNVHSDDLVSILGQTGGRDTSNITESKYADIHFSFLSL